MTEKIRHSLLDIVAAGLAAHGYSGLVTPGVCGCRIDELSPGGCLDDGWCLDTCIPIRRGPRTGLSARPRSPSRTMK